MRSDAHQGEFLGLINFGPGLIVIRTECVRADLNERNERRDPQVAGMGSKVHRDCKA